MKPIIFAFIGLAFVLSGCNAEFDVDDAVKNSFSRIDDIEDENTPVGEVILDLGDLNDHNEVELPADEINRFCNSRTRKRHTQLVEFEPPGRTCEWNQNDNLGPVDFFFQARIEQKVDLDVPNGTILCSMRFNFPQQSFLYDDHFLLNLNRTVIASSYNWSGSLEAGSNGLLKYDWFNIRGNVWDTNQELIYCPQISGAVSSCTFPDTDQQGVIDLDLSTTHVENSMANGVPLSGHYFQMVTIGDNNQFDCEHTGMEFTVEIEYIE